MKTLLHVGLLCAVFTALTSYDMHTAPPSTGARVENAIKFVHDPSIVRDGEFYYCFSTGSGIPMRRSKDLIHWELAGSVFKERVPDWALKEIPESRGWGWAPQACFFNGRFHVYYAVSSFGSNHSLIALVSNKTLDAARPDYHWEDDGKVIGSTRGQNYNAIDPGVILYPPNRPSLTFGSFWSGIKLVSLDARTGKPAPNAPIVSLAQRPPPDAIEAPFLVHRGRYYYLFVSFDFCCRGVNSTYNIRVGRASHIAGPYLDREGKSLLEDGGTIVLATQGNVIGPGHCMVLEDKRRYLLIHHFYDGGDHGVPTLQVRPLTWTPDGWPMAGAPLHE